MHKVFSRLAWIILLGITAAMLTLRLAALPHLDRFRPWIEQRAAHMLGAQVSLGALSGRWHWRALRPEIEISDLNLRDAAGRPGLSIPHAIATLSWRTLWEFRPVFEAVHISAPAIVARRAADGRIWIAGIPLNARAQGENAFIAALLAQAKLTIRGGMLCWRDEALAAPPLVLNEVQLSLSNKGDWHRLEGSAGTPEKSGLLKLSARIQRRRFASSGDPIHWKGKFELVARALDLASIARSVHLPIQIEQGSLSGRLRAEFNAMQIHSARGELDGKALRVRFKPNLSWLELPSLAFSYHIRPIKDTLLSQLSRLSIETPRRRFSAERLNIRYRSRSFNRGGSIALWPSNLSLRQGSSREDSINNTASGDDAVSNLNCLAIEGDAADLGLAAELMPALPAPRTFTDALARFKPHGVLRDYAFEWMRDHDSSRQGAPLPRYRISARLEKVGIAAQPPGKRLKTAPGWPGFDQLSGTIKADQRRGVLILNAAQASVTLGGVFDDSTLAFDTLKGRVHWEIEQRAGAPAHIHVRVPRLRFANVDAAGAVRAIYQRRAGTGRGTLDLSAAFDRFLIARAPRYLPSRLNAALRAYLSHALKGGIARRAILNIRGDLDHFPFQHPRASGVFQIVAPFENGRFDPSPHIESGLEHFSVRLHKERARRQYGDRCGRSRSPSRSDGGDPAAIPNTRNGEATQGKPLKNALAKTWPALDSIQGVFKMDGRQLGFDIDRARYRNIVLTDIQGRIGNLSRKTDDLIIDGRARGPLADLLHYVNASPVAGWLGGLTETLDARGQAMLALRMQVPRIAHTPIRTSGALTFIGNTLIRDALPPLTAIHGLLNFTEHDWTLQQARAYFLGGAITGAGGKKPEGSTELSFEGTFSASALRDATHGPLNALAQRLTGAAPYRIKVNALPHAAPRFAVSSDLSGLQIDLPAPLGKTAQTSMPAQAVWDSGFPKLSEEAGMERRWNASSERRRIHLREFQLGPLMAHYVPQDDGTGAAVRGHIQLNESVPVTPSPQLQEEGITARIQLDALNLDAWYTAVRPVFRAIEDTGQPDLLSVYWPNRIQAKISALTLGRRHWQNLMLDAVRRAPQPEDTPARASIWQIDALRVDNPDAQMQAHGYWRTGAPDSPDTPGGADQTNKIALDFSLRLHDAGALLTRLGLPNTVHGGAGVLTGRLGWQGKARLFKYSDLNGSLTLDVRNGRILPLDPGLSRLLGLFSVQNWARFLTLSERGAFGPGLDFDRIHATGTIHRGILQSGHFEMDGQNARISVQGRIDLAARTQDLRVTLLPVFKADAAALAAVAIHPFIGMGGYVVQWALLPPLANYFMRQYAVTGTWRQPSVQSMPLSYEY